MKKIIYISSLVLIFLGWSCAKDDSTLGGMPISEITIEPSSVAQQYNLAKNMVLTIEPVIEQTISGKPLSYEWEVEHSVYSTDPIFNYTCNELGSFDCRLIVSNEDGKAFKSFTINVNTPYEEGLMIISKDQSGESRLSFMLHDPQSGEDTFYSDEVFSKNNPEIVFAPNVSDILVSNGSLIISCLGNNSIPPTLYYLNAKTMDLENYVSVPEYSGFAPINLLVCSVAQPGASYPILSADGKIYDFASTEGTVVESSKFPSTYDIETSVFYDSGSGANYNIFFWDNKDRVLVTMFNGYGGYYCLLDYDQKSNKDAISPTSNIFAAGNDTPIAMFIPRYTPRDLLRETPNLYVLTESQGKIRRTIINKGVWSYNMDSGLNYFDIKEKLTNIGAAAKSNLQKGAPMIASNTHKSLFFADGNTIYRWNYAQGNITSANVFATIGDSKTIIKGFDLSEDQNTLYVASYNSSQIGLNGSCHIIEINRTATTEDVYAGNITTYENISYEPVKIIYKKK